MVFKSLTSHDRFFRSAMADSKIAKEFFTQYLPANIQNIINLDSIEPQKDSFVEATLKTRIADMLYSADFNDRSGYLYVLIEHQSTVDSLMPLRLLRYMLLIMENHINKKHISKLPIIYPMVFYTGKKPYYKSMNLFDLFGPQKDLAKNILFGPYQLIDLTQIPDQHLEKYLWSGVMAKTMKHIWTKNIFPFLKELLKDLQTIEKQDGIEYIVKIFSYILNTVEISNPTEFIETVINGLSEKTGEQVMTIAQQLIEQGISQGITQGIAQGIAQGIEQGKLKLKEIALKLLKQGLPADQVIQITELSPQEIEDLSRENW